jgi:dipeptidyl aminopeptidase/acylaminoacyl peptidase
MAVDGGEAEAVTTVPVGAIGPTWLPDGSGLVFLSYVYVDALDHESAAARKKALADDKVKAKVTEAPMYRFWDRWLTDGMIPHLFHLDLATGNEVDLMPGATNHWTWDNAGDPTTEFDVSPDGSEVAFSAVRATDPAGRPVWGVSTVDLDGGEPRLISGDHPADCVSPRYSPDGSRIIYGRQERTDFYADRVRLVAYDRSSGSNEVLTETWDRSATAWEFSGADRVLLSADNDGRVQLFEYTIGGPDPEPVTQAGSVAGFAVGCETAYLAINSLSAPSEIYRLDGTRMTDFATARLTGVEMGDVEDVRFAGADGAEIQMWVCYPPGFDDSRQWPLVHLIHGGPHGIFGDQWHQRWNAQVVAAAGYVVPMVNFHGSTSWGQEFASSIQGAWGDKPYLDVMAATDAMTARGFIDPTRVAVTGGSYGGYLTAWIISQSDRFACAIAHAAVTNLAGMYASDWVFHRSTAYGAEYWQDPARVDRWSPAAHATGYSTPTLVIHGEQDYRVPLTQGLELYGVLKSKGVEARLAYYPDENHWILKPQNSLHWYGEFLGWLDRFLAETTS